MDEIWGGGSTRWDIALRHGTLSLKPTSAMLDALPAGPDTAGGFNKNNLALLRQ